jgi:hypothetical protein
MILMFILTVNSLRNQLIKLKIYSPTSKTAKYRFKFNCFERKPDDKKMQKSSVTNYSKNINLKFEKENFSIRSSVDTLTLVENSNKMIKNNEIEKEVEKTANEKLKKLKNLNLSKISQKQTDNSKHYVQNEIKAVKVLGVVFTCFIVSWLPYCLINIGTVLCNIYKIEIFEFQIFLSYLTYIGYISSTFNPIIYTAFNKKFRQNFIQILKCKKK